MTPAPHIVAPLTPTRNRPRRQLTVGLILLLIVADAVLLGWLVSRRDGGSRQDPDTSLRGAMSVLHRQGLAASLDTLERWAERDSSVLRDGHQMAHALGRQAVLEGGGDPAVIRECRPAFASGCYHGVVEAALRSGGKIEVATLQRLCLRADSSDGPGPGYECVHGLGHGILGAVNYDVPAALHYCDALSGLRLQTACHSGTFMEAISAALSASVMTPGQHHQPGALHPHGEDGPQTPHPARLVIDSSNPYSPCMGFADPYASSCWLFQGFVILRRQNFDATRALAVCDGAPNNRIARCYQSVGHQLTGLFQEDDAWIVAQCSKGRSEMAAQCAAGATLALDALDWSGTRAVRLCAAVPGAWKDACYRTAFDALVDVAPPSRRNQLCSSVDETFAQTCRNAWQSSGAAPGLHAPSTTS